MKSLVDTWNIPTTGRSPAFQAAQCGFSSVAVFAKSLPQNAIVADVGAGVSRFGHEVARARPDITWINIDPCYKDKSLRQQMERDMPANVTLFSGDVVEGFTPPKLLTAGADLVYSYWALPHMSLRGDAPAAAAIGTMYKLLKPRGKLIVGPIKKPSLGLLSLYRYKGTVTYTRRQPRQKVITDAIARTKLWWLPRVVQNISNTYNIHFGMYFVRGTSKKKV